jgi:hypothetical protein
MLTRGILKRGTFWSDVPRLPSFDRTAHQYAKFEKKVTNWAGICWHVACWHVADFDRTVQICNFCVSAVSCMESRFFVSRKCFFLHLPFQAAGLLGLRFRAPNGITGRAPTTPREVPTWVGRTATYDKCQLLIGRHRFEAYSVCHVAKIDMWYHLIGHHLPRVKRPFVRTTFDACRSGHVAAMW